MTQLHTASERGNTQAVNRLLREGANVNARNYIGFTPLHKAVWKGHLAIVNALLRAGANANARTNVGYIPNPVYPLHEAPYGDNAIVNALIRAGARVNARDNVGYTLLHKASLRGDIAIVNALLRAGAHVNARNNRGSTPLHEASSRGHIDVINALLKAGGDPFLKTKYGKTSFDVAKTQKIRQMMLDSPYWNRSKRQTLVMKSLGNRLPPNIARRILENTAFAYNAEINNKPGRRGKRLTNTSNSNTSTKRQRR